MGQDCSMYCNGESYLRTDSNQDAMKMENPMFMQGKMRDSQHKRALQMQSVSL